METLILAVGTALLLGIAIIHDRPTRQRNYYQCQYCHHGTRNRQDHLRHDCTKEMLKP